ncbi:hypothetical protein KY311_02180 [Candidatus Woesearchaeota archaeon]|nr:hypothetical protein [Candidatus Woesearchaeota archaeon]MBW3016757.1 hypothetical protein [Candidatus Woesearchaeota archaeon]
MSKKEHHQKFVEKMLESASKNEETKPNTSSDVDPKEMESIMKDIQEKAIKQKK